MGIVFIPYSKMIVVQEQSHAGKANCGFLNPNNASLLPSSTQIMTVASLDWTYSTFLPPLGIV
jgi:hypothetical protein